MKKGFTFLKKWTEKKKKKRISTFPNRLIHKKLRNIFFRPSKLIWNCTLLHTAVLKSIWVIQSLKTWFFSIFDDLEIFYNTYSALKQFDIEISLDENAVLTNIMITHDSSPFPIINFTKSFQNSFHNLSQNFPGFFTGK